MKLTLETVDKILENMTTISPILVLGDVGIDKYTYGEVSRISPEAPVPVVEVQKEWKKLGLAANVTDNLQALRVKSSLSGVVGEDNNAQLFFDMLENLNVSSLGMLKIPGRMTTFKERIITSLQQICRVDYETTKAITEDQAQKIFSKIENMITFHSGLLIEDYGKGMLTKELTQKSIQLFRNAKKFVAVDPSRNTPAHFYKGASLLKPNLAEAKILCEQLGFHLTAEQPVEMAKILLDKLDLEMVVITLGSKGICLHDKKEHLNPSLIPTMAKEVFDVSGAGDTVISVLTSALIAGASLWDACYLSNIAAGIVVSKKGTATTTALEMKKFYQTILS